MMNIVLATDNNYIEHCATTLMSIVANNRAADFYIITDCLHSENIKLLTDIASRNASNVFILKIDKSVLSNFPMPDKADLKHISLASYYRLFSAEILPSFVDKVIYMDCDIVVRKSLDDLFNIDLEDKAIGVVYQSYGMNRNESLGFPSSFGYFNAGVLLINIKYWRDNDIQQNFLNYIKNSNDKILYHDQDVLNAVLYDKCLRLSPKWNMMPVMFKTYFSRTNESNDNYEIIQAYKDEVYKERSNPTIIHYVSAPKPWEDSCRHQWRSEYVKYSKMAGFKFDYSIKSKIVFSFITLLRRLKIYDNLTVFIAKRILRR